MANGQNIHWLLGTMRDGDMLAELSRACEEVADAVEATGKPGQVTLTIGMKPVSKGASAFTFSDKIVAKAPVKETEDTLFYRDEVGGFTQRDPRQPKPRAAVVDVTTGEIAPREAANG